MRPEQVMALLQPITPQFCPSGRLVSGGQIVRGHINRTYLATVETDGVEEQFVQQWINTTVFPRPVEMMSNIKRVVEHIALKRPGERGLLRLIENTQGLPYFVDDDGGYWRMYNYIGGTVAYDVVPSDAVALEAARTFGRFLNDLADLDARDLFETIPDFHNTPKRLERLKSAIALPVDGQKSAVTETDFAMDNRDLADRLTATYEDNPESLRATHNDTKVNNVLFCEETGAGITVIDLDTVMPGSILFDVGDLVRTACNTAAEDEQDLSLVSFDTTRFRMIVRGFAETVGQTLTNQEWDAMPYCGATITYECGMRFLTDHLEGDRYFAVHREGHNLDRCRTQFELVRQMRDKLGDLRQIVQEERASANC